MSRRPADDPDRLGPEADDASPDEAWPDEPDAWEASDREWREKWEPREEDEDAVEPPPAHYQPRTTSAKGVASSYEEGMREAGPYLTIGLQIALSMFFFVGAGWALDEFAGTSPWGVLVGAVLGFLGVIGLVIRLAHEADASNRPPR
ncbi:MAG: AtpZ/AtpI family protein [Bacteroidota bacterium]